MAAGVRRRHGPGVRPPAACMSLALATGSTAWPRLRLPAGLMGLAVCLIAVAALFQPALDPDLGWHLRTGQLILASHAIPRTDPFSFTRAGAPWVEQEWLSQ